MSQKTLVYSKEGVHRENLRKSLMPLGFTPVFTHDVTAVTSLIAEVSPVLYIQDWYSLDNTRNADLLRKVFNTDPSGTFLKAIGCNQATPEILAIAGEAGVRKILTYATLVLDLKKVSGMIQMGLSGDQKFQAALASLREGGDNQKSEEFIENSFKKNPKSVEIRLEFGNLELLRDNLDSAKTVALSLIKEDKSNVRAMNLLSRVSMKSGDFSTAEKVLQSAEILSPNHPDRLVMLGNIYYDKGDQKKASGYFDSALIADPGNPDAVKGLGTIKLNEGDSEALVQLFGAHSSEAETAGFFNNAAVSAVKNGKLEEGLKLYEIALKALKTDNFKSKIYFNLALTHRRMSNLEDALKAINRSLKYDGTNEKAKHQLEEIQNLKNKVPA